MSAEQTREYTSALNRAVVGCNLRMASAAWSSMPRSDSNLHTLLIEFEPRFRAYYPEGFSQLLIWTLTVWSFLAPLLHSQWVSEGLPG